MTRVDHLGYEGMKFLVGDEATLPEKKLRREIAERVGRNSAAYSAALAVADYAFGTNPPYVLYRLLRRS